MRETSICNTKNTGFTLIELMVVLALIGLLSVGAIASFTNFSHSQTFQSSVNDFIAAVNFARSSAASQVKPNTSTVSCKANSSLVNYQVTVNTVNSYQVVAACNDGNVTVSSYTFPNSNITFSAGDVNKKIIFLLLTGGVSGANQVTINGYSQTRIVNIDSIGKVTVQ